MKSRKSNYMYCVGCKQWNKIKKVGSSRGLKKRLGNYKTHNPFYVSYELVLEIHNGVSCYDIDKKFRLSCEKNDYPYVKYKETTGGNEFYVIDDDFVKLFEWLDEKNIKYTNITNITKLITDKKIVKKEKNKKIGKDMIIDKWLSLPLHVGLDEIYTIEMKKKSNKYLTENENIIYNRQKFLNVFGVKFNYNDITIKEQMSTFFNDMYLLVSPYCMLCSLFYSKKGQLLFNSGKDDSLEEITNNIIAINEHNNFTLKRAVVDLLQILTNSSAINLSLINGFCIRYEDWNEVVNKIKTKSLYFTTKEIYQFVNGKKYGSINIDNIKNSCLLDMMNQLLNIFGINIRKYSKANENCLLTCLNEMKLDISHIKKPKQIKSTRMESHVIYINPKLYSILNIKIENYTKLLSDVDFQ